ncbi:2-dehydropantoate 2-reductase [Rhodovastum atsumiense]|uniref:ketopantoate reductase family protein n=1 Tax=Rhodovastum atsumiense TaxID=504468 RepID=UPI00193BEF6C|nr:ketopantoate reductase family protein [Rhodovastum atsumiense]CAH2599315.1 2-dehydropantoate 2-reductase [Rhodovastum atsumiense]
MRILVLGAGGIGGYYGGRLAAAGGDVTFLVRPRRAEQLMKDGLVIRSPLGDAQVPVKTILREHVQPGWDAIIIACKSYDLEDAIEAVRPAAPGALIVPQLNGLRHLDTLDAAFGAEAVTGGVAQIAVTLDEGGAIRHLSGMQGFVIGARHPAQQQRVAALHAELERGGFGPRLSDVIMQDMWEKFAFLCTLAGICCLMRAGTNVIACTEDGAALTLELLDTCLAVATTAGFPPRERFLAATRRMLTDTSAPFAASMLRDLQRGGRVEADHIVGDMLARAKAAGLPATLLRAAYAHLQVYEAQRG